MSWGFAPRPPGIHFFASYPKSGNTWIRLACNVYVTGVCDINFKPIASDSDIHAEHYQQVYCQPITSLHSHMFVFLRSAVLMNMAANSTIRPVIIKTHQLNGQWNDITLFPTPLMDDSIYLVRDPRDVCVSLARHTGKTIDETIVLMASEKFMLGETEDGIPTWISNWSHHVMSWEEKDYTTVIRYEDLLADPETHFTTILKTLRLKVNKQKLRKAIRLTRLEALMKQEARHGFAERKNQERFFGQGKGWKNELTDKQIRRVEEDHAEVMKKYGYEPHKHRTKLKSVG